MGKAFLMMTVVLIMMISPEIVETDYLNCGISFQYKNIPLSFGSLYNKMNLFIGKNQESKIRERTNAHPII